MLRFYRLGDSCLENFVVTLRAVILRFGFLDFRHDQNPVEACLRNAKKDCHKQYPAKDCAEPGKPAPTKGHASCQLFQVVLQDIGDELPDIMKPAHSGPSELPAESNNRQTPNMAPLSWRKNISWTMVSCYPETGQSPGEGSSH